MPMHNTMLNKIHAMLALFSSVAPPPGMCLGYQANWTIRELPEPFCARRTVLDAPGHHPISGAHTRCNGPKFQEPREGVGSIRPCGAGVHDTFSAPQVAPVADCAALSGDHLPSDLPLQKTMIPIKFWYPRLRPPHHAPERPECGRHCPRLWKRACRRLCRFFVASETITVPPSMSVGPVNARPTASARAEPLTTFSRPDPGTVFQGGLGAAPRVKVCRCALSRPRGLCPPSLAAGRLCFSEGAPVGFPLSAHAVRVAAGSDGAPVAFPPCAHAVRGAFGSTPTPQVGMEGASETTISVSSAATSSASATSSTQPRPSTNAESTISYLVHWVLILIVMIACDSLVIPRWVVAACIMLVASALASACRLASLVLSLGVRAMLYVAVRVVLCYTKLLLGAAPRPVAAFVLGLVTYAVLSVWRVVKLIVAPVMSCLRWKAKFLKYGSPANLSVLTVFFMIVGTTSAMQTQTDRDAFRIAIFDGVRSVSVQVSRASN